MDLNKELKFVAKIKKNRGGGGGRIGRGLLGMGCQDECERRIEVFVKIRKKIQEGC